MDFDLAGDVSFGFVVLGGALLRLDLSDDPSDRFGDADALRAFDPQCPHGDLARWADFNLDFFGHGGFLVGWDSVPTSQFKAHDSGRDGIPTYDMFRTRILTL